jgi:hypothetical protein
VNNLALSITLITVFFYGAGALAVIILGVCVIPSVIRRRPKRRGHPATRWTAPTPRLPLDIETQRKQVS